MRKPDEIALYAALRAVAPEPWVSPGRRVVEALAAEIGIPDKRIDYLCEKWARQGFTDYGINAVNGWFNPGAPMELTP